MEEEVKSFLQANLSFLWVIVKCNKDLLPIESILENWPYYLDYYHQEEQYLFLVQIANF